MKRIDYHCRRRGKWPRAGARDPSSGFSRFLCSSFEPQSTNQRWPLISFRTQGVEYGPLTRGFDCIVKYVSKCFFACKWRIMKSNCVTYLELIYVNGQWLKLINIHLCIFIYTNPVFYNYIFISKIEKCLIYFYKILGQKSALNNSFFVLALLNVRYIYILCKMLASIALQQCDALFV